MILESFTSEEAKLYYGIGSFFGLISPVVFAIGGSRFSLMYHKDDFNSKSYLSNLVIIRFALSSVVFFPLALFLVESKVDVILLGPYIFSLSLVPLLRRYLIAVDKYTRYQFVKVFEALFMFLAVVFVYFDKVSLEISLFLLGLVRLVTVYIFVDLSWPDLNCCRKTILENIGSIRTIGVGSVLVAMNINLDRFLGVAFTSASLELGALTQLSAFSYLIIGSLGFNFLNNNSKGQGKDQRENMFIALIVVSSLMIVWFLTFFDPSSISSLLKLVFEELGTKLIYLFVELGLMYGVLGYISSLYLTQERMASFNLLMLLYILLIGGYFIIEEPNLYDYYYSKVMALRILCGSAVLFLLLYKKNGD